MRKLPLHVHSLLAHAAAVHPHAAVVSLSASGEQHSSSYAELAQAAARRASALLAMGIVPGDTLCSVGLSSVAQLEALYAALSVGACTHLLNPQFDPEQALALVRQAAPRLLLHDDTTAPLARQLHAALGAQTARLSTNVSWGTATAAREVAFKEELPTLVEQFCV